MSIVRGNDIDERVRFILDADGYHNYKDVDYVRLVLQNEFLHIAKEFDLEDRARYADKFYFTKLENVQEYRFLCKIGKVHVGRHRLEGFSYVVDENIARKDLYDFPQLYYEVKREKNGSLVLLMINYKTDELFRTYKVKRTIFCSDNKEIHRC